MSMADNIRKKLEQRKAGFSSETEVRDAFNTAASKSLQKFLQRIDTGEIPIDNMSDFVRLLGAYKEINDISGALEGSAGQSMLPEINMKQDKVVDETIASGKMIADEEGLINTDDMSEEDMAELLRKLDIAQNQLNEGSF
ncbi:terminase small subunit [Bacillus phage Eldridge]|uniref:Uncharacterized protein n=1 Tax=Bacillus phage Eldridge TaxID=1776293 RepID=A0A109QMF0_9CAUD|nr:terminase small subunit [Bacillus phage Eldridge]AMB18621.1 hypothetical protein Eldridge_038 [Bacillus phage Eldridge]